MADDDDTLRRMGELVRTIRQLAASEANLRAVLSEIAAHDCTCSPVFQCPPCIATAELIKSAAQVGASSWEKC